jgi:hypothetical protein
MDLVLNALKITNIWDSSQEGSSKEKEPSKLRTESGCSVCLLMVLQLIKIRWQNILIRHVGSLSGANYPKICRCLMKLARKVPLIRTWLFRLETSTRDMIIISYNNLNNLIIKQT